VGQEGLPAGEIALRLGVQQNTLSDHLKALSQAGVLGSERRSRSVIYRSNDAVIRELAAYLVEHCLTDSR
jgi:DNA-binding transcriptional ArsR family regulator